MTTTKPAPLTGSLLARKGQARPAIQPGNPTDPPASGSEWETSPDEIGPEAPPYSRIDEDPKTTSTYSAAAYSREWEAVPPAPRTHSHISTYGEIVITPVSRSREGARRVVVAAGLLALLVGAGWIGMTWLDHSERVMTAAVDSPAPGLATGDRSIATEAVDVPNWTGSEAMSNTNATVLDPPPLPGLTAASGGGGGPLQKSAPLTTASIPSGPPSPVIEPAVGPAPAKAAANPPAPTPVPTKMAPDQSPKVEPAKTERPATPTPTPAPIEKTATAPPKVAAVVNPAPAPQKPASTANGRYLLQLMSFAGSSQAESARADLQRKHATLLAGAPLSVAKAEVSGRGTFYRVQTGPLASFSTAQDLCAKLKALKQDCLVVRR